MSIEIEDNVHSVEYIVDKKWKLIRRIGSGSFGNVYFGVHVTTGEEVAVKLESINAKNPQLLFEARVYNLLQDGTGVARIKWFGIDGVRNQYNALVMDLLGPSLEDLFNFCGRKFTMKTVLMVAEQAICRLEFLHSKNLIHRDIKPENLLMGIGRNCNKMYLIDFGLAKRYRDFRSKNHVAFRDDRSLTGTARFAGINSHAGCELSRRDDLESLGYMLMYFLRSQLPWQGMKARNRKQKYERIYEKKVSTPIESLCKGYPPEFHKFLNYSRALKFEESPDYKYLRDEFRSLFKTLNFMWDYVFDWTLLKQKTGPPQQNIPIKIADNPIIKETFHKK